MLTKKFKKSPHISEDGASSVQGGILNMLFSKICLDYDRITLNGFL